MFKHDDGHDIKIEAGQIMNPDCFPPPNELVCVQVQKIFDQVSLRDCVMRTVTLIPGSGVINPMFTFEGADDFDITEVKVISKSDSMVKPGFKRIKLYVKIRYNIYYSDGINQLTQPDEASFNLTINEIYCPSCLAQIGVIRYPEPSKTYDPDGLLIKVEALVEAFNDAVNPVSGHLTLDIGVFFVVKCACDVQLLMPAYGYCPVPPEQTINPATQNCTTFSDPTKTPFPTQFFPDQKWNPLDNNVRRDDIIKRDD